MYRLFYILSLIVFLYGCSRNKIHRTVEIYFTAPLFHESGAVIDLEREFSIYSFEDALVYELPFYLQKETDTIPKNVKKFFIFRHGAKDGLMYFPALPQSPKIYKVDSVLKAEAYKGVDFIRLEENVLISRSESKDTVKEVYIPKIKKDISYPDTLVVTYLTTKLDLEFSISKSLEEVKKTTVTKIDGIFNTAVIKGITYRKNHIVFALKVVDDIPREQQKKVQEYLKKFEQDAPKLIKEKG